MDEDSLNGSIFAQDETALFKTSFALNETLALDPDATQLASPGLVAPFAPHARFLTSTPRDTRSVLAARPLQENLVPAMDRPDLAAKIHNKRRSSIMPQEPELLSLAPLPKELNFTSASTPPRKMGQASSSHTPPFSPAQPPIRIQPHRRPLVPKAPKVRQALPKPRRSPMPSPLEEVEEEEENALAAVQRPGQHRVQSSTSTLAPVQEEMPFDEEGEDTLQEQVAAAHMVSHMVRKRQSLGSANRSSRVSPSQDVLHQLAQDEAPSYSKSMSTSRRRSSLQLPITSHSPFNAAQTEPEHAAIPNDLSFSQSRRVDELKRSHRRSSILPINNLLSLAASVSALNNHSSAHVEQESNSQSLRNSSAGAVSRRSSFSNTSHLGLSQMFRPPPELPHDTPPTKRPRLSLASEESKSRVLPTISPMSLRESGHAGTSPEHQEATPVLDQAAHSPSHPTDNQLPRPSLSGGLSDRRSSTAFQAPEKGWMVEHPPSPVAQQAQLEDAQKELPLPKQRSISRRASLASDRELVAKPPSADFTFAVPLVTWRQAGRRVTLGGNAAATAPKARRASMLPTRSNWSAPLVSQPAKGQAEDELEHGEMTGQTSPMQQIDHQEERSPSSPSSDSVPAPSFHFDDAQHPSGPLALLGSSQKEAPSEKSGPTSHSQRPSVQHPQEHPLPAHSTSLSVDADAKVRRSTRLSMADAKVATPVRSIAGDSVVATRTPALAISQQQSPVVQGNFNRRESLLPERAPRAPTVTDVEVPVPEDLESDSGSENEPRTLNVTLALLQDKSNESSVIDRPLAKDDMFARMLRDSNNHRGLDISCHSSGPVHSITGFALPPTRLIAPLPSSSRRSRRKSNAKILDQMHDHTMGSSFRAKELGNGPLKSSGTKSAQESKNLTLPREFNFNKRPRPATEEPEREVLAKKPRLAPSAAFAPSVASTRVISKAAVQSEQPVRPPSRAATAVSAISNDLTAEALQEQEQSFRVAAPDLHSRVSDFLKQIEQPEQEPIPPPVPFPEAERKPAPSSSKPTAKSLPVDAKAKGPVPPKKMPLQSKNANQAKSAVVPAKKRTVVKPFSFYSDSRVRGSRRVPPEKQADFDDNLNGWRSTEAQAQSSVVPRPRVLSDQRAAGDRVVKDRVIKPVERKRKREGDAPKLAVKEFRFATDKRLRRGA